MSRAAALEMRNVVKEYPGFPPVRALDDVSVRIDHGELIAVVGPQEVGNPPCSMSWAHSIGPQAGLYLSTATTRRH